MTHHGVRILKVEGLELLDVFRASKDVVDRKVPSDFGHNEVWALWLCNLSCGSTRSSPGLDLPRHHSVLQSVLDTQSGAMSVYKREHELFRPVDLPMELVCVILHEYFQRHGSQRRAGQVSLLCS